MNKKYFFVTALCLVMATLAAIFYQRYFPETPLYTQIIGVISGTLGSMIAYIWDDKRHKNDGKND
jgi:hypothetical protein